MFKRISRQQHPPMTSVEETSLRKSLGQRSSPHSKVCVLASGGLDSCVLLGRMAQQFRETFPVYIRCGLRWERAEIYWLRKYLKALSRLSPGTRKRTETIQHAVLHPLTVLNLPVRDVYGSHWSLPEVHQKGTSPSGRTCSGIGSPAGRPATSRFICREEICCYCRRPLFFVAGRGSKRLPWDRSKVIRFLMRHHDFFGRLRKRSL